MESTDSALACTFIGDFLFMVQAQLMLHFRDLTFCSAVLLVCHNTKIKLQVYYYYYLKRNYLSPVF